VSSQYRDTAFSFSLAIDGTSPIVLNGTLDGTVTGASATNLVMTFNTTGYPLVPDIFDSTRADSGVSLATGGTTSILNVPFRVALLPSTTTGGVIQPQLFIHPVPEPASAAIFLSAIAVGSFFCRKRKTNV
jgi:hypothetical protein